MSSLDNENVIEVSDAAELMVAMNNASGGDVISLLPGDYDIIRLTDFNFDSPVTITSADPDNLAHLENLYIRSSSNITIEQLAIHSEDDPIGSWGEHLTYVSNSADIILKDNKFGNDSPTAHADNFYGLAVTRSSSVEVVGNEFSNLGYGAHFSYSQDLNISDNLIHNIRTDGLHFSSVQGVNITGNTIKDMHPAPGDHSDNIQFANLSSDPADANTNIVIRDNLIMQGDGESAQGIFMRSESGVRYENVVIENNVVYQSGYHGITVANADGVEIRDNTVISPPDTERHVWILGSDISNAVIENNISNTLSTSGDSASITLINNVLTETSASSFQLAYEEVFTGTLERYSQGADNFEVESSLSAGADINALLANEDTTTSGDSTDDAVEDTTTSGDSTDDAVSEVVSGNTTGSVFEDGSLVTNGNLDIEGGSGNSEFLVEDQDGQHGRFSVDAEGNWSYVAQDSSQIQALNSGDKITETFSVNTSSGVETEVQVFINGQDEDQPQDDVIDTGNNGQAEGNVIEVSSAAELMEAMSNASGGDVISLLPGDYDIISLKNFDFDSPVTITSADPDNLAHMENLYIRGSSNITIDQLAIYSDDDPRGSWGEYLTYVSRSSDIVLKNNNFGNDSPTAHEDNFYGLAVSRSTGVDVIGNEFSNLGYGAQLANSQDLNVSDNFIHDISSKGLYFSGVQGVEVTGNTISDMNPEASGSYHSIQLSSLTGQSANTDIVIRDNMIMQGDGGSDQGIFMKSESGVPYENVIIENNSSGASIYGGKFSDTLSGSDGEDGLSGRQGNDVIIGGNGFDIMSGGEGSDIFQFSDKDDSGLGGGIRDKITDFDATNGDHISFEGLASGTFEFIGDEDFFMDASNSQASFNNSTKILSVDLDGDQLADMEIELVGVSLSNLDNSDFIV
ncbi:MAG: right-handed parallel beta-helix repeat-containing protein [Sneathiella sp.]